MASFLEPTQPARLTDRFTSALVFAADAHSRQIRKQGEVPYLSHLMAVSGLVLEAGGDEDMAIAALLHDYVEDVDFDNGEDSIRRRFGKRPTQIVMTCTAKTHKRYLDQLTWELDFDNGWQAIVVSAADKLHNIRCYCGDGKHLWKPKHREFFLALLAIYDKYDRVPRCWVEEMEERIEELNKAG